MERKKSKTISLNQEEFYLLCKCSDFSMFIFSSVSKVHEDFAKFLSEYVALSIALKDMEFLSGQTKILKFEIKEEYFETIIKTIKLVLPHLSIKKYGNAVTKLYNLLDKVKKEGK